MSYNPRQRDYVYSDSDEFEIVEAESGKKRIYLDGPVHTASEYVCDGCGIGVPFVNVEDRYGYPHAVQFGVHGKGFDHKVNGGGFFHVDCLPEFIRPFIQEY